MLEYLLRQSGNAATPASSEGDQGTSRVIIAAYAAATDLPLLSSRLPIGRLPEEVAGAGPGVQATGLALRGYSMRALGAQLHPDALNRGGSAGVGADRPLPADPSSGLPWLVADRTGFALTSRNLPTTALVSGALGGAYARRIAAEQPMLRRELPGYGPYARNLQARPLRVVADPRTTLGSLAGLGGADAAPLQCRGGSHAARGSCSELRQLRRRCLSWRGGAGRGCRWFVDAVARAGGQGF